MLLVLNHLLGGLAASQSYRRGDQKSISCIFRQLFPRVSDHYDQSRSMFIRFSWMADLTASSSVSPANGLARKSAPRRRASVRARVVSCAVININGAFS